MISSMHLDQVCLIIYSKLTSSQCTGILEIPTSPKWKRKDLKKILLLKCYLASTQDQGEKLPKLSVRAGTLHGLLVTIAARHTDDSEGYPLQSVSSKAGGFNCNRWPHTLVALASSAHVRGDCFRIFHLYYPLIKCMDFQTNLWKHHMLISEYKGNSFF